MTTSAAAITSGGAVTEAVPLSTKEIKQSSSPYDSPFDKKQEVEEIIENSSDASENKMKIEAEARHHHHHHYQQHPPPVPQEREEM